VFISYVAFSGVSPQLSFFLKFVDHIGSSLPILFGLLRYLLGPKSLTRMELITHAMMFDVQASLACAHRFSVLVLLF